MDKPTVTAKLKNLAMSPQKVRLVTDIVKGKEVNDAVETLRYINKSASLPVAKLILSAAANAEENKNWDVDDLMIADIQVGDGITLKRGRFVSRGRYRQLLKRKSNIVVTLAQSEKKSAKSVNKATKKSAKKSVKKTAKTKSKAKTKTKAKTVSKTKSKLTGKKK